jgi:hypothetical protein
MRDAPALIRAATRRSGRALSDSRIPDTLPRVLVHVVLVALRVALGCMCSARWRAAVVSAWPRRPRRNDPRVVRAVDFPIARLDDRARRASEIASCPAIPAEAYPNRSTIPASPRAMFVGVRSAGVCRVSDEPSALALMGAAQSRRSRPLRAQPAEPDPGPRFEKRRRAPWRGSQTGSTLYRAPREFCRVAFGLQRTPIERRAAVERVRYSAWPGRTTRQIEASPAPFTSPAHGGDGWELAGVGRLSLRRHVDRGRGVLRGLRQAGEGEAVEFDLDDRGGVRAWAGVVHLCDRLDYFDALQRGECGLVIAAGGRHARRDQQVFGELRRARVEQPAGLRERDRHGLGPRLQQACDLTRRPSESREFDRAHGFGQGECFGSVACARRPALGIAALARLEGLAACRILRHGHEHTLYRQGV